MTANRLSGVWASHVSRLLTIAAVVLAAVAGARQLARAADDAVSVSPLRGAKRATLDKAVLNVSALQPGKQAMAAVVLDIKPGFHAQSHTPTADYLIKFTAKVDANPALEVGEPVYPRGQIIPFKGEPKELSVYEGRVVIRFPVKVKADAAVGPTQIKGTLGYQICDDKQCFAPEKSTFTIETEVVAADKKVEPNEAKLFEEAEKETPSEAAPSRGEGDRGKQGAAVPAAPGSPASTSGGSGASGPSYSLLGALGVAFLVGIVFNAVPCVLPVLPLKAMGFYEVSQHNRGRSIAFGVAFSLGVVAAFATLGLLVVVLRAFTWGQLFSNPWFSAVLAVILVVMALNMFGLFTVNLPGGVYGFSPRHDTYFGNVLFGILTAALSTPCTFGLFVSILGYALTQSPAIGMLVVVTVGVGMAFPYLLLSAFPEVARRFPRTGPWPEVVKQFMGFLLLAVAVFFAQGWVGRVVGSHNVWWVIFAILAGGAVFLVARSVHYGKTAVAPSVAVVLALLLVVPTFFVTRALTVKPYTWQPYSAQSLASARGANRVVLVDFTADWCANCHTVEAFVLNRAAVQRDVNAYGVEMIKADLTKEDAPGWALLKELGGEGIPLTVVYVPGTPEPIRLPGLYRVEELRDALARAAKAADGAKTAVARG